MQEEEEEEGGREGRERQGSVWPLALPLITKLLCEMKQQETFAFL